MPLYTYTIEQNEIWDKIVRSFSSYDVYYLSGYVKAFQIHGDGEPFLFYYESDTIRGMNVVMKRDISADAYFSNKLGKGEFFDFITPYGYGGWIIEGKIGKEQLFLEYESWCKEHRIVSEFVRFHPLLDNASFLTSFYDVQQLGNTISMDVSSHDIIWANLTSKNRNMIRKAEKHGVKIYHGHFPEIYNTFRNIYNATMDSDNAKPYYYFESLFYDSIVRDLSEEAQVFWAEIDGKIIATSIMLSVNGRMNYHLSGSVREYQHLAPSNLLLYKAALWGCSNGYKTFHLGGGVGSKEDSLYKFKSAFNRNETKQFAIGKKIYLNGVYDELVAMKEIDDNVSFFPKYRA